MTINLEAAGTRQAPSARYDGQHAEARQDRWLFELEHALLQLGTKKGAPESNAAGRGVSEDLTDELGGKPHKRRAAADVAAPNEGSAAQAARAEPALPSVHTAAVSASAQGQAQQRLVGAAEARPASLVQPVHNAPDEMSVAASALAAPPGSAPASVAGMSAAGAGTALVPTQAPGATPDPAAQNGESSASEKFGEQGWHDAGVRAALAAAPVGGAGGVAIDGPTGAYAAAGAALGRAAGGGVDAGAGTLARAQAARPAVLAASLGMAPEAGQAAPQEAPLPTQEEAAPQHAERREQAHGAPFEKKLLHLYRGADGVQAWIRDAELNAAQIRGVAQALAAELEGGARLAALTVNGRKIIAAPPLSRADAEEDDDIQPAGDDSASASFAVRAYTFGGTV